MLLLSFFKINAALSNRSLDNKATTLDVPVADIFVSAETQMFNYTFKKGYDNIKCFLYQKQFHKDKNMKFFF